jgi:DNA polymerase-3 subunit alpha
VASFFGHLHTHTKFSALDGMAEVDLTVQKAAKLGQPFMAITDHGNLAGAVDHYMSCRQHGVEPLVGVEGYLCEPEAEDPMDSKTKRFHVGLVATNLKGYAGLADFVSKTHTRPRFSRYPRFTLQDLAELGNDYGKHLILTTGCFFGLVQQRLVNEGPEEAERVIKAYAQWFPHTFVELQNHSIDHEGTKWTDDMVCDELYDIAMKMGLPVVATQDSHYLNQKDKLAHALMKRMVYSSAEDGFPGDAFHFSTADWVEQHHTEEAWAASEQSMEDIFNMAKLRIPELDTFKAHVPTLARKAELVLKKRCEAALEAYLVAGKIAKTKWKAYRARLAHELDTIEFLGMANYFLLVRKVVDFCERKKICIETRGSGNGSLVLFVQGITQVDPIRWGTNFERFLSKDRAKMPDVDLDVEDKRREEVLAFMASEWQTMRIGTWTKLGMTVNDEGEERGSVVVTYLSYLRRITNEEAMAEGELKDWTKGKSEEIGKARFNERYGHIKGLKEIRQMFPDDYKALLTMLKMDSVYKSYGVHAGGVLFAPDDIDLFELIPTMLVASSDTIVSQFDMDAVEKFGALKLDLLGQSSLTTMRICQTLIGRENPNDFTWIPYGDAKACAILREGRADNGVFHFEGYSKAKGGKEMGIKSVHDAIVASALYMPAAVDSGQKDRYIKARNSPSYRAQLKREAEAVHPIFEEELRETNWLVIYQEQPLNILRALGMTEAMINMTYKVLKDSGRGAAERNAGRLVQIREEFDQLCIANGIDDEDTAWHYIAGYDVYGFNKAHSTGYGIRSYRTAYLKAHYPLEYMTALLQVWAGRKTAKKDREALYVRDARRIGIRLLPPDVNVSGPSWTLDRLTVRGGAIRKGLVSVTGVGVAVADAIHRHAPFANMDDLAGRTKVSGKMLGGAKLWIDHQKTGGVIAALEEAGALESLYEVEEE